MDGNSEEMQKVEVDVELVNKYGLHARPAMQFSETARKFNSDIFLGKDGVEVNAKSIIEVMTIAAGRGTKLTIRAEGEDASEAVEALRQLVSSKFGEE